MPLLIDTSVAIGLRDLDPFIVQRSAKLDPPPMLSIISVVELESGVVRSEAGRAERRQSLDALLDVLQILDFGGTEAAAYGRIVAACGYSRRRVIDRMIAAQAIVAGATLATLNPRDFADVPDLRIEDWTA